ncbi:MAG: hypothetical protein KBS76_01290 [Ruminococcus sp.]|nr:hypothetical protein [Candidatus Apopatosoma intestinale]
MDFRKENKKHFDFVSHYCADLDDNVFVMETDDGHGGKDRTCLSSHLCRRGTCDQAPKKDGNTGPTL